jgi:glycosyltransferase involved in cell wall biosynthesis
MPPRGDGRIIFDITTSMRWYGPPAGIVRVERQLALWASAHVQNVVFVFFDPRCLAYCALTCGAREFLTGEATLDTLGLTHPALPGGRRTDRIPPSLRSVFLWGTQTRRKALKRLETLRLTTRYAWIKLLADCLQRRLMSRKYSKFMMREDGTRRPFYPYEMVIGPPITFVRDDTLVCTGGGWENTNILALDNLKAQCGFRMILLCHDLIPLMFPRFFRDHDVKFFEKYMRVALAIADSVVVNSHAVERDIRQYCKQEGIAVKSLTLGSLGFDIERRYSRAEAALPVGLRPNHFVLFVSTIEPRKGHALVWKVWRRLMAEGVPQAEDFKLVFVGRIGWMVDDLLSEMRTDLQVAGRVLLIQEADDDLLAILYRHAAFCVYPSMYEGYGLPLLEAFSHGKGVLASTGGALPELAQELSPCIDPTDVQAWYEVMKKWIQTPEVRDSYEREIKKRFRHSTWSEVAERFFDDIYAVESVD